MARSGGAWSVKGIDQATRDIARRAAQASGLTIGEWIDRAIRTDAGAAGHEPPQSAGHDSGDIGATGSVVSDDETMRGLEVETAGAAADGSGVPVATEVNAALSTPSSAPVLTTETLNALYARLDETDRRIEQTLKPMAYRLHDLAVQLVDAEGGSPAATLDRRHSARDDLTEETPHLDSPASALSTVRSETIAAAERARRLARPTPQPPADDFPLDASGLEPIGTLMPRGVTTFSGRAGECRRRYCTAAPYQSLLHSTSTRILFRSPYRLTLVAMDRLWDRLCRNPQMTLRICRPRRRFHHFSRDSRGSCRVCGHGRSGAGGTPLRVSARSRTCNCVGCRCCPALRNTDGWLVFRDGWSVG